MKKLFLFVLVAGAAVVLLGLTGMVKVPGIPSLDAPRSNAEKLTPPKDVGQPTAPPKEPEKNDTQGSGQVEAKRFEPASSPTAPAKPRSLYPPIKPEDVARARGLYEKGDLASVGRALEGCERAEIEDAASTQQARILVRKARLLLALTKTIVRSPLATATRLEKVSLDSGGTVVGNVVEKGEQLVIQLPGSVETSVAKDSVVERTPVARSVLDEKLRARLAERVAKVDGDDAIGNFRLGHYCWQYGLVVDAMPYLDKAVEGNDFPVIARVFGGSSAEQLVDGWCELTGKPRPGAPPKPTTGPSTGSTATTTEPAPKPTPVTGSKAEVLAQARKRYDEGVGHYKNSFGDSASATTALKNARAAFIAARDVLAKIADGDVNDAQIDELQTQIARLLYDCNKRSAIH